jgi:hypothetical protein
MENEMNISSAQYFQTYGQNVSITIVVDGTKMSVPLDPANRHYAEILKQVASGDLTIADAD